MTEIEKLSDTITIDFTKEEYKYLQTTLSELYNGFSKLPKKLRTPKFYILQNLVKETFFDTLEDIKQYNKSDNIDT